MIAKLEYMLPREENELRRASRAENLFNAILEIDKKILEWSSDNPEYRGVINEILVEYDVMDLIASGK